MAKKFNPLTDTLIPEGLKKIGSAAKDILFWNFKKAPVINCIILSEEKLEYDVYKVKEVTTNLIYYIPKHKKIVDMVGKYGKEVMYVITLNDTISFDGGKKTYNSYDIDVYELPK